MLFEPDLLVQQFLLEQVEEVLAGGRPDSLKRVHLLIFKLLYGDTVLLVVFGAVDALPRRNGYQKIVLLVFELWALLEGTQHLLEQMHFRGLTLEP